MAPASVTCAYCLQPVPAGEARKLRNGKGRVEWCHRGAPAACLGLQQVSERARGPIRQTLVEEMTRSGLWGPEDIAVVEDAEMVVWSAHDGHNEVTVYAADGSEFSFHLRAAGSGPLKEGDEGGR